MSRTALSPAATWGLPAPESAPAPHLAAPACWHPTGIQATVSLILQARLTPLALSSLAPTAGVQALAPVLHAHFGRWAALNAGAARTPCLLLPQLLPRRAHLPPPVANGGALPPTSSFLARSPGGFAAPVAAGHAGNPHGASRLGAAANGHAAPFMLPPAAQQHAAWGEPQQGGFVADTPGWAAAGGVQPAPPTPYTAQHFNGVAPATPYTAQPFNTGAGFNTPATFGGWRGQEGPATGAASGAAVENGSYAAEGGYSGYTGAVGGRDDMRSRAQQVLAQLKQLVDPGEGGH